MCYSYWKWRDGNATAPPVRLQLQIQQHTLHKEWYFGFTVQQRLAKMRWATIYKVNTNCLQCNLPSMKFLWMILVSIGRFIWVQRLWCYSSTQTALTLSCLPSLSVTLPLKAHYSWHEWDLTALLFCMVSVDYKSLADSFVTNLLTAALFILLRVQNTFQTVYCVFK